VSPIGGEADWAPGRDLVVKGTSPVEVEGDQDPGRYGSAACFSLLVLQSPFLAGAAPANRFPSEVISRVMTNPLACLGA